MSSYGNGPEHVAEIVIDEDRANRFEAASQALHNRHTHTGFPFSGNETDFGAKLHPKANMTADALFSS